MIDSDGLERRESTTESRNPHLLGIEKDQLQVHAGPEHKHVLVQLDLGDGRRGQRVTNRHQAQVLDAAVPVAVRRVARVDARLRITGTVDYLQNKSRERNQRL